MVKTEGSTDAFKIAAEKAAATALAAHLRLRGARTLSDEVVTCFARTIQMNFAKSMETSKIDGFCTDVLLEHMPHPSSEPAARLPRCPPRHALAS